MPRLFKAGSGNGDAKAPASPTLPPGVAVGLTLVPKCSRRNLTSPGGYRALRKILHPWLEKHFPGAARAASRARFTSASGFVPEVAL